MRTSRRVPFSPKSRKKVSLPQTMLLSSRRKTAIGSGKWSSALFLALSAS